MDYNEAIDSQKLANLREQKCLGVYFSEDRRMDCELEIKLVQRGNRLAYRVNWFTSLYAVYDI